MKTKKCSKCGKIKLACEFYKRSDRKIGLRSDCKECERIRARKYINLNREKARACYKKWYGSNREYNYKRHKSWCRKNYEHMHLYSKEYRKKNAIYRVGGNIGSTIWHSLKANKNGRRWETLIGYTLDDLKQHLENQFKDGMSWSNYGFYGWHIDHIIPVSSFNYSSFEDEDFKKCWSLSNLQPLWAFDNLSKGNKII